MTTCMQLQSGAVPGGWEWDRVSDGDRFVVDRQRLAATRGGVGLADAAQPPVDLGADEVGFAEQARDLVPDELVELLSTDHRAVAATIGPAQRAAAALVVDPGGLRSALDDL